ncbi:MAG: LamG-like jellyroll fold domain-containing protein, partial [Thermodesulfobacteriota bacterium]|nr:LamG-like jellyroll fold domain-containing protein [Thermodesulfobacteriota bacterium]
QAKDAGEDLSATFTDDIDGNTRAAGTDWDIGADERTSTAIRSSTDKPIYGVEVDTNHPLANGLVGAWVMNEGSGDTVHDLSGNGNDGTLVNSPTWDSDGVVLNGSTECIEIQDSPVFTVNDFTWVLSLNPRLGNDGRFQKYDNTSNDGFLIQQEDGPACWEGAVYVGGSAAVVASAGISYGTIEQITLRREGSSISLFVGTTEYVSGTSLSGEIDSSGILYIGHDWVDNNYFDGIINYAYVYDRALSADEISQLHNEPYAMFKNKTKINTSTENVVTDGLVGHWTFDGPDMDWSASSAEAIDQSGQGNDGDVVNGATPAIGISGQALNFDGDDDYVDLNNPLSLNPDYITVSAWIKTSTTGSI